MHLGHQKTVPIVRRLNEEERKRTERYDTPSRSHVRPIKHTELFTPTSPAPTDQEFIMREIALAAHTKRKQSLLNAEEAQAEGTRKRKGREDDNKTERPPVNKKAGDDEAARTEAQKDEEAARTKAQKDEEAARTKAPKDEEAARTKAQKDEETARKKAQKDDERERLREAYKADDANTLVLLNRFAKGDDEATNMLNVGAERPKDEVAGKAAQLEMEELAILDRFPEVLAEFRKEAARYDGPKIGYVIDLHILHIVPARPPNYPPDSNFLAADGMACILKDASFNVATYFTKDQVGCTCGYIAVDILGQCADQLANGTAVNALAWNGKEAASMPRIIKASKALPDGKTLAKTAKDAPFLNNADIDVLMADAVMKKKVAAAVEAGNARTPRHKVQFCGAMSGSVALKTVTRLMLKRSNEGSKEWLVMAAIVNKTYTHRGTHWYTLVVALAPCNKRAAETPRDLGAGGADEAAGAAAAAGQGDPAKKAEEDAASKTTAEEEAAAKKKKAEEDAASENDAASKTKAEVEAAAERQQHQQQQQLQQHQHQEQQQLQQHQQQQLLQQQQQQQPQARGGGAAKRGEGKEHDRWTHLIMLPPSALQDALMDPQYGDMTEDLAEKVKNLNGNEFMLLDEITLRENHACTKWDARLIMLKVNNVLQAHRKRIASKGRRKARVGVKAEYDKVLGERNIFVSKPKKEDKSVHWKMKVEFHGTKYLRS